MQAFHDALDGGGPEALAHFLHELHHLLAILGVRGREGVPVRHHRDLLVGHEGQPLLEPRAHHGGQHGQGLANHRVNVLVRLHVARSLPKHRGRRGHVFLKGGKVLHVAEDMRRQRGASPDHQQHQLLIDGLPRHADVSRHGLVQPLHAVEPRQQMRQASKGNQSLLRLVHPKHRAFADRAIELARHGQRDPAHFAVQIAHRACVAQRLHLREETRVRLQELRALVSPLQQLVQIQPVHEVGIVAPDQNGRHQDVVLQPPNAVQSA
mmetsp:Transcript_9447/g.35374  ORF Transcript_9447/g.35374 Transcript_9447/m.35374 type:complete len:266 (+) Transcript_9447:556-1353(+)